MNYALGTLAALAIFALGFLAGRWTAAPIKVGQGQLSREPSRVGDVGPRELPYWGGDRT